MAAENGTVPAKTTDKASETTREYVVLTPVEALSDGGQEMFALVGRPTAATDGEARKMVGSTLPADEKDNPLVAVPARYWKPKARKVKVTTSESWD